LGKLQVIYAIGATAVAIGIVHYPYFKDTMALVLLVIAHVCGITMHLDVKFLLMVFNRQQLKGSLFMNITFKVL